MPTRSRYSGGVLTFFDNVSYETTRPLSPVVFEDDFIGGSLVVPAAGSAESGMPWVKKIVGAAPPTVAGVADAASGVVACALTAASEKQDAALYMDDQRCFSLEQGLVFECRAKITVIPTGAAEIVLGLISDWIDGLDNATYSAFFTADGSGEIFCEMDDNATDTSVTSGITVLTTEWHVYRIEFLSVGGVRFYIDGVQVATGTTFAYAATGANAVLQPVAQAYKASGTGVGTVQVDYIRCWQNRS